MKVLILQLCICIFISEFNVWFSLILALLHVECIPLLICANKTPLHSKERPEKDSSKAKTNSSLSVASCKKFCSRHPNLIRMQDEITQQKEQLSNESNGIAAPNDKEEMQ